jgi:hypothetical protein
VVMTKLKIYDGTYAACDGTKGAYDGKFLGVVFRDGFFKGDTCNSLGRRATLWPMSDDGTAISNLHHTFQVTQ